MRRGDAFAPSGVIFSGTSPEVTELEDLKEDMMLASFHVQGEPSPCLLLCQHRPRALK